MSEEIRNLLEGLPFWKHLKGRRKETVGRSFQGGALSCGGRRLFRGRRMSGSNLYF